MKFLTIDASKSINPNTGEAWYRAEVKVSVDDSEKPEEVFKGLKERLDSWLPNPFEISYTQPETATTKDSKESATDRHLVAINASPSLKELETFKLLAKNNKEYQEAYDNKLKSFQ